MNVFESMGALVAFLGIVAIVPAMAFWVNTRAGDLSLTTQFFAAIIPVALVLLFLTSWFEPGGVT